MSSRLALRTALVGLAAGGALAPTAASAAGTSSTPLAGCAAAPTPVKPTVQGIRITPRNNVPISSDGRLLGALSWNVTSPARTDLYVDGDVYVNFTFHEWGLKRIGQLGLASDGCVAQSTPLSNAINFDKYLSTVTFKPYTAYTVYVQPNYADGDYGVTPATPFTLAGLRQACRTSVYCKAPSLTFTTGARTSTPAPPWGS